MNLNDKHFVVVVVRHSAEPELVCELTPTMLQLVANVGAPGGDAMQTRDTLDAAKG